MINVLHLIYFIPDLACTGAGSIASTSRVPNYEAARIRRRTALDNASTALAASIPASIPVSRASTRRTARPNNLEAGIWLRLQRGRGITEFEQLGLFECCGFCRRYFLSSLLRRHLIVCTARP